MMFNRFPFCLVLFATTMIVAPTANVTTARAQDAPIIVDGEPITELEIEQRSKFTQAAKRKVPSGDEVIDELRDEKLKVHEALRAGLRVTDSEVDDAYAKMGVRMRTTQERLTEILEGSGVSADTVKHMLRADLASKKMLGSVR
jgi:peptidyl-prolyl cis-trans isomerase SurA